MYSYIYDPFLQSKRFEKVLSRIENSLTDLGIQGKLCRLSLINTLKSVIEEEIRKGSKTIVIVGNDKTISQAIDAVVPHQDITLGLIPVGLGEENQIAQFLGIPPEEEACKVLSSRIVKNITLGKANEAFFIYNAIATSTDIKISVDKQYVASIIEEGKTLYIYNFPHEATEPGVKESKLVAEISNKKSKNFIKSWFKNDNDIKTSLPFEYLEIKKEGDSIPILLDGQKVVKTPVKIFPSNKHLQIIVGRYRKL